MDIGICGDYMGVLDGKSMKKTGCNTDEQCIGILL
jgi:hypothetical protein